jgi:hypothetical protein
MGVRAYSESSNAQNPAADELDQIQYFLGSTWLQNVLSVAAVIATVAVYWREQSKIRNETIKRSCDALLHEIEINQQTIVSDKYEHITYTLEKNPAGKQISVNFTNAFLDIDAYQSILFSGSFTHFTVDTQYRLTMLYSRIRNHNDVLSYTDHFQDLFFLHENETKETLDKWFSSVSRYDLLITRWENEILQFFEEVKPLLQKERIKRNRTIFRST